MLHVPARPLPIVVAAMLIAASLAHAGPPSRELREPPREKVNPAELARIASEHGDRAMVGATDRKSTRLNSSHLGISYAVFCLKKKKKEQHTRYAQILINFQRTNQSVILNPL